MIVDNIAIPLELNDRFIPPDLEDALQYYPNFSRYSQKGWSIKTYLCAILKEIDKNHPNGYNGDKAFGEFMTHVGLARVKALLGNN